MLLTNLPETEFPMSDLKELYHLRWGVETAFRQLKYDDCSSFSNTRKKVAAIGEIILSLIFPNICTSVLVAVGRTQFSKSKNRKLYASGRDPTITIRKIVKEPAMNIQPVRNDRVFSRILKPRSSTEQLDLLHCSGNPSLALIQNVRRLGSPCPFR